MTIEKSITDTIIFYPWFAGPLLRLQLSEDTDIRTYATDGREIKYNPIFVSGLTQSEGIYVLLHELLHAVLGHPAQGRELNRHRCNVAMDYAVNGLLADCGVEPITGALYDKKYTGLSWQEIYRLLPHVCGNPQYGIDVIPGTDNAQAQAQADSADSAEQLAQIIAQYEAITGCGTGSQSAARVLMGMCAVRSTMHDQLYQYISRSATDDWSFTRRARRHLNSSVFLPSLRSDSLSIAVAIDTSGSVSTSDLSEFASILRDVVTTFRASGTLYWCDAGVCGTQDISAPWIPVGGGGTSYVPFFAGLDSQATAPACAIYLTDGECSDFPLSTPPLPVLWVTKNSNFRPPFGEVIQYWTSERR